MRGPDPDRQLAPHLHSWKSYKYGAQSAKFPLSHQEHTRHKMVRMKQTKRGGGQQPNSDTVRNLTLNISKTMLSLKEYEHKLNEHVKTFSLKVGRSTNISGHLNTSNL